MDTSMGGGLDFLEVHEGAGGGDGKMLLEAQYPPPVIIMRWRASQPKGIGIPKQLQICEKHKLAFCGDWFDFSGFGRIEGAIQSALNLSSNIIKYLQIRVLEFF